MLQHLGAFHKKVTNDAPEDDLEADVEMPAAEVTVKIEETEVEDDTNTVEDNNAVEENNNAVDANEEFLNNLAVENFLNGVAEQAQKINYLNSLNAIDLD